VVDGTTASMPDTPENQAVYPQPASQKPGLGFPLARLVAVLSLNCAAVLDLAIGPHSGKQGGESALFRTLFDRLEASDVLLADRYYASYWMIAMLRPMAELVRGIVFTSSPHLSNAGRLLKDSPRPLRQATAGRSIWLMDRGADRPEMLASLLRVQPRWIVRLRSDRRLMGPGRPSERASRPSRGV